MLKTETKTFILLFPGTSETKNSYDKVFLKAEYIYLSVSIMAGQACDSPTPLLVIIKRTRNSTNQAKQQQQQQHSPKASGK